MIPKVYAIQLDYDGTIYKVSQMCPHNNDTFAIEYQSGKLRKYGNLSVNLKTNYAVFNRFYTCKIITNRFAYYLAKSTKFIKELI